MADFSELFIFGDDFDAILGILEEDDELDNHFTEAADEVELDNVVCNVCQKRCKSKRGLKRHMTVKHPADNSSENEALKRHQLTPEIYSSIIEKAKDKIANSKIYTLKMRDEASTLTSHVNNSTGFYFSQIQEIYKSLIQTGNAEKFYAEFYSTVVCSSHKHFGNLSGPTATLLSTKVADFLLVHSKEIKNAQDKEIEECHELSNIELSGLQYVGGYVLHNLHKKLTHIKIKTIANEQAMSILKAGKRDDKLIDNKLTTSLNRGGLWNITTDAQLIFERAEHYFRLATSVTSHKIDCSSIISRTVGDVDVVTTYNSLLSNSELVVQSSVAKDVLHSIVQLYTRVRSFSFAKDIIQKNKIKAKQLKCKALRKEINRASNFSDQERLS